MYERQLFVFFFLLIFFFLIRRRPTRSTLSSSSAASDVYKRQVGIGIDAVQDAAQLVLLLAQQSVQTIAEPRVEDLHGIGGADSGDLIGLSLIHI